MISQEVLELIYHSHIQFAGGQHCSQQLRCGHSCEAMRLSMHEQHSMITQEKQKQKL